MDLTYEQITNEPAGRQMDAWVAEFVMKWKLVDTPSSGWFADQQYKTLRKDIIYCIFKDEVIWINKSGYGRFKPSLEDNSAWKAVNKMRKDYLVMIRDMGEEYCCEFLGADDGEPIGSPGFDKLAPLAICRAALLAVMERNKENGQRL